MSNAVIFHLDSDNNKHVDEEDGTQLVYVHNQAPRHDYDQQSDVNVDIPAQGHGIEKARSNSVSDAAVVANYKSVHHTLSLRMSRRGHEEGEHGHVTHDGVHAKNLKDVDANEMIDVNSKLLEDTDVHMMDMEKLLYRLHTSQTEGLDVQAASAALLRARADFKRGVGSDPGVAVTNTLTPVSQRPWIVRVLLLFTNGFNLLLMTIGLIDVLSWEPLGNDPGPPNPINWYVGLLLFICVFVGVLFNAYQLSKSSKIMQSFINMIPPQARVLRNSVWSNIPAVELRRGDIVSISMGSKVPADIRITTTAGLRVDNSMLTGESEPILSSASCTNRNILESRNIIYFGSMAVEGSAQGVVVNIGDDTVMGKITKLTATSKTKSTSLENEIQRFVNIIMILIFLTGTAGLLTWAFFVRVSYPAYLTWQLLIANMCAFVVGYTPEGLPLALTMVLTIVAKRMVQNNILVKDLATIETFNTITLIASDKTGTLTMNKMAVHHLQWSATNDAQSLTVNHLEPVNDVEEGVDKVAPPSSSSSSSPPSSFGAGARSGLSQSPLSASSPLVLCATLCSGVTTTIDPATGFEVPVGDASDLAIYQWCKLMHHDLAAFKARAPRLDILPFNSRNKFMITTHNKDGGIMVLMKGAPEIVMSRCKSQLRTDLAELSSSSPIEPLDLASWKALQETRGAKGERVLAFACLFLDPAAFPVTTKLDFADGDGAKANYPAMQFTLIGIFSLIDPPRPEVKSALSKCRSAQVRVAMVTGDHTSTARAIASQIGLLSLPDHDEFVIKADRYGIPNLVLVRNGKQVAIRVTTNKKGDDDDDSSTPLFSAIDDSVLDGDLKNDSVAVDTKPKARACLSCFSSGDDEDERQPIAKSLAISGEQLALVEGDLWRWIFRHEELVFARTSPEQKLLIVTEAQRLGEKVAVTGDGVNDAPALKKADLGIAMQAGSEVAREAGHIVLLDNNFNSIVVAIELGRAVFDNLKKVCMYLLPAGTWSEMLTIMVNIFFGIQNMLSSFLMIVICLITDVFVSVAMVNETPEDDIMTRPPRKRGQHLVDARLILTAYMVTGNIMFLASTISFFWYCSDVGLPFWGVFWAWQWGDGWYGIDQNTLSEAVNVGQSIFFVNLVIMQFGNCLAVRTRHVSLFQHNPLWGPHKNRTLGVGILCATITFIVVTEASFFQTYFLTRHVPVKFVGVAILWAFLLIALDEARKWTVRNRPDSVVARYAW